MSQRNVARMKCCYSCAHYALESDEYPCSDCGHPDGPHSHWQDAVEAMRERCAKICADLASEYHDKRLSAGENKEWDKSREYFIRSATAAECVRKIRGEE